MRSRILLVFLSLFMTNCSPKTTQVGARHATVDNSAILGRWDVTVYDLEGVYPSWFEINQTDGELTGRFVGRFGSARPLRYVHFDGSQLYLSLPRQYEKPLEDLLFVGTVSNGNIDGETKSETGARIRFHAEPAPALASRGQPQWGKPIQLIQNDLSNWQPRHPNRKNGWQIENGMLVNKQPRVDLVTRQTFEDFKLHLEFNFPEGSNSGIYLRGRYEVQIEDNYGQQPGNTKAGGVYGFIPPRTMAIKPAGQWNFCDITLLGRRVTVVLNDQLVIDNAEIPGITGGALDSREAEPGPLMLQGDHGPIRFRNVVLTPAR